MKNIFVLAILTVALSACQSVQPVASRPATYPAEWKVQYTQAKALPADYAFGHQISTFKKGQTFAPAEQPLVTDIEWERDIAVPLRDGTVIYADVLRPVGGGKFPAIVAWSPYGKTLPLDVVQSGVDPKTVSGLYKSEGPDANFWVSNGYAIVHPDPRGIGKSEGDAHVWGSVDADDGYDVIEWIAQQPWSNGHVGMHGTSWLAMAQWFIAAKNPPHLKAIALWNGASDIYRHNMLYGGIPNTAFGGMVIASFKGGGKVERPDLMAKTNPLMSAYWQDKSAPLEAVKVPAYVGVDVITDLHRLGAFEGYRRLGSERKWLRVNNNQEWTDQYSLENQQDLLNFFDYYLKGKTDNGWLDTPKVRTAILDKDGKDAINVPYSDFPIPGTQYQKLYLSQDQTLENALPQNEGKSSYVSENEQISFTHRFAENTQLTGYFKAKLWVATDDTDDMDMFVLVEKLDKDGNVVVPNPVVAQQYLPVPPAGPHGRLRVSLRALDQKLSKDFIPVQSFTKSEPLKKGEIVPVEIAIMPHSVYFKAGEQIRLTIAGQEFKGKSTTENSGSFFLSADSGAKNSALAPLKTINKGRHHIYTGGKYDSYLFIPAIPQR